MSDEPPIEEQEPPPTLAEVWARHENLQANHTHLERRVVDLEHQLRDLLAKLSAEQSRQRSRGERPY